VKALAFVKRDTQIEKSNGVVQKAGAFFDLTTPHAHSAKASIIRAISTLVRTGLFILAPTNTPFRWGYVLTATGLQRGLAEEGAFPPALIFRAGLLVYPTYGFPPFHTLYDWLTHGVLTLQDAIAIGNRVPPTTTRWQRDFYDAIYKSVDRSAVLPCR
jgi:hypothetical protein